MHVSISHFPRLSHHLRFDDINVAILNPLVRFGAACWSGISTGVRSFLSNILSLCIGLHKATAGAIEISILRSISCYPPRR